MPFLRRFVSEGATPLLIVGMVACLYALAAVGLMPLPSKLFEALATRLTEGAAMFIAGCSLLENTVGVNGYFPGAFVILFAMAQTHGHAPAALRVFGAIVVGALTGQTLSYLAGRLAADQRAYERRRTTDTFSALGVFWHPVLGSAYSFSAGRHSTPYGDFLFIMALAWAPWNIFWGALMYCLGGVPVSPLGFLRVFAVFLCGWLLLALIRAARPEASPTKRCPNVSRSLLR